jgi:hypothetical protein
VPFIFPEGEFVLLLNGMLERGVASVAKSM